MIYSLCKSSLYSVLLYTTLLINTIIIFSLSILIIFYIGERDTCPSEPPIRVGRVTVWRKEGEINVSGLFKFFPFIPSVSMVGKGEGGNRD